MKKYEISKEDGLYVVYKYDSKERAYRIWSAFETLQKAKEAIAEDK